MHILILNWRDTKNHASGGAEISLLNHVQYWQTKGVEITWVSSHFPGGKKDEVIDGIRYIRLGSHYTVHIRTFWYVITGNLKGIDVVIDAFHFIPYFSPLYLNKCKIIALINEPAKNAWFKNIWFPLSLLGYLLEPLFFIPYRNKQFITSSQTIATELEKYHLTKEQIVIIPHGTELPDNKVLPKKSKNPVIIFLAQLSPDKGIEDAIQAFVSVKKKRKDSEFWIVGKAKDDQYLEKLKQLVKSLHLSSQVTFLGFISKQKKFDVLAKSWVLVHPSIREGWGLNVIEANSVGTPAVGYNVVGLRDSIQDRRTGLLVDTNSQALADGVIQLITDKTLYETLAVHAKKWSNAFSWEKSVRRSWKVLNGKE